MELMFTAKNASKSGEAAGQTAPSGGVAEGAGRLFTIVGELIREGTADRSAPAG